MKKRRRYDSTLVGAQIGMLLLGGEAADQIRLGLAVGRTVGAQDFVKPDGGLAVNVGMLPGFPRQIGLRLAGDESPVDGADMFLLGVASGVVGAGLVPNVPGENAVVLSEGSDEALDVGLEARNLCGVGQRHRAGTLHPAGIMDAGNWGMLRAEMRQRIPAGVEEDKHRTNVMARGDGQEAVEALLKAGGILLPKQIVQEDAHGVHAEGFGPG